MNKVANIQYITRDSEQYTHAEQARLMFENQINWVQLRMKGHTKEEIEAQAEEALHYARKYKGVLIINDSVEIAGSLRAHGVHLGMNDLPVDEARKYLGPGFIIGGTANTVEDIKLQAARGADYIGLGPFRFTTTKKNLSPVIGLSGYRQITNTLQALRIDVPIVAVGGITPDDIPEINNAGIPNVAISGALLDPWLTIKNKQSKVYGDERFSNK